MKKITFLVVAAFLFCGTVFAQTVQKENFEFNKKKVSGYTLTFADNTVDIVAGAMKERLEKTDGLKPGKKTKDFHSYMNQQLAPLGQAFVSIYTKTLDEGKKNAKYTKLYFVVASDNGTPITPETHPSIDQSVQKYLNEFSTYLVTYENNQKLIAANALLTKSKKELEVLKSDKSYLEKEIEKFTTKIVDKEKEIKAKEDVIRNVEADVEKYKNLLKQ